MPTPLQQRYAFWIVIAGFVAVGILFGAWQVMLADLQKSLDLSEGELGFAMTCGVFGSFPAMFLTGGWSDRWGARRVMAVTCLLSAVVAAGFYWVNSYLALIFIIFLLLGAAGALDVAMNAAAVNYEQNTQDKKMSFFHAGYSGAAAFSALGTGFLLFLQVPFRTIYLGVALLLALIGVWLWRSKHLDAVISYSTTQDNTEPTPKPPFIQLFKSPLLVLLASITALSFFTEGTLEMWSAVYLRLSLDLPVLLGAAGPAVFHTAMMLGRLTSGWVLGHFDRFKVLLSAGVVAALGMSLSLITVYPPLILTGFLLAGLALASIVPIVYSLAGDVGSERAGQVISMIAIVGYAGFLLGPSLIGTMAELFSLRLALGLLIVAAVGTIVLGLRLKHYYAKPTA